MDIIPREKQKQVIALNLRLNGEKFIGGMTVSSFGYEAFEKRSAIKSKGTKEKLNRNSEDFTILQYEIDNQLDLTKPLIEKFQVESSLDIADPNTLYLNPCFVGRYKKILLPPQRGFIRSILVPRLKGRFY